MTGDFLKKNADLTCKWFISPWSFSEKVDPGETTLSCVRPRSFISLQGCEHHHATFISWEHETDRPAWNTILCCRQAQIGAGGLFQHRWTQVGPDCSRWDTRARGVGFPFELFSPWTCPVLITSILKVNTDLMSRHIYTHTHTHSHCGTQRSRRKDGIPFKWRGGR